MGTLNIYGDKLVNTTGTHGADISSQRMDNLDLSCLNHVLSHPKEVTTGLDLGCGLGTQSLRLALLGVQMHLYDLADISDRIEKIKQIIPLPNEAVTFYHQDVVYEDFEHKPYFDLVYSQRFIHYLPYSEAQQLVRKLYGHTNPSAMVFISASGITTELAENYIGKDTPIEDRFYKLSPVMAKKHAIRQPVCLYHKDELCRLFTSCGFSPLEISLSEFGNIKAIFKK